MGGLRHFILGVIKTCENVERKARLQTLKHYSHNMNLIFKWFLDFLAIPIPLSIVHSFFVHNPQLNVICLWIVQYITVVSPVHLQKLSQEELEHS